jgi:hypothetical protein
MDEFRNVSLDDYMMVWLGIVGPCVGLNVPLAMSNAFLEKGYQ